MRTRSLPLAAALLAALVSVVLSVPTNGPAQAAPAVSSARCKAAAIPRPITSGQTSSAHVQVRWAAAANVAKYRLRWSPGPYGNWPGYNPYTGWHPRTARLAAVTLPKVGRGDKFINVAYGNPTFARIQVNNGCSTAIRQSPWVAVWPKAPFAGNSSTGEALTFGSYNVEKFPTLAKGNGTKIANLAKNIASKNLTVLALQEAQPQTAIDLRNRLRSVEKQTDWQVAAVAHPDRTQILGQQILYRGGSFQLVRSGFIGRPKDTSAATPLLTPWAHLTPTVADAKKKDLFVVSAHLEEPATRDVLEKKRIVNLAARSLIDEIGRTNGGLPTVVAGDLRGNFQRYCDETSKPACHPDGQPTFVRAGYLDAQGAGSRVNVQYATVNKHDATQPANASGFGGRADFILTKGFPGTLRYEVVRRGFGNGSETYQSDHNLIVAHLFVPHVR